jgi:hypothetical protein
MTSGPYTVDVLGYTCATMAITMGGKNVSLCKSYKNSLSSNCFLKLESMKEESLVIAYHYDAVNFLQLSYTQPVRRRKYVGWDTSDGFEFSVIFYFVYKYIYTNSINVHYSASNLLIDNCC